MDFRVTPNVIVGGASGNQDPAMGAAATAIATATAERLMCPIHREPRSCRRMEAAPKVEKRIPAAAA